MLLNTAAPLPNVPAAHEPVAIIGIGCRFPAGIQDPESFWRALLDGTDAITEIPDSRFDAHLYYDPRPATPGKIMTRWGGFLTDVDKFDAYFFGISPREADRMDPQQRVLLEVAWEALEDAGQKPRDPRLHATGVFVGMWLQDYESKLFRDPKHTDFYMTTGSGRYVAAGRLSYLFDFQGPSLTVDTACSSSLVAVHLACQSLQHGECNLALAGGVNVILQPHITIAYSQSKMMAPDGRCKFGDARGDGYVRSEGCGVVVLKRLADALADGDPIYAIIAGSAVNNDGRSSGFLATPGTAGQKDLLRKAYQAAGIAPGHVQYVEAHGTGTRAGDPVEVEALGSVLAEGRPSGEFCYVGSVKTNLGHTEGAAGIAGLIKVALALKHSTLPASLHFQTPNPAIPWEQLPIRVQTQAAPWPEHEGPAVAGVSAFGIAGTNAHVVLMEAPAQSLRHEGANVVPAREVYVLPLSAQTPEALTALVAAYRNLLESSLAPKLHDLCYTASVRRAHHRLRAAFVAGTREEMAAELAVHDGEAPLSVAGGERKIVFVFSGQGSQWVGMGRRLLAAEPAFRAALEACDRALRPFVNWFLLEELAAPPERSRLDEISVVQPALFAIQVALAAQWRAWGVEPQAVIGHSMGEVAAACVAGALSLEDAAQVICSRSRLMQEISGQGAMAVAALSLAEAERVAAEYAGISVAVSNSPRSTVLTGDPVEVQQVVARLEAQEIFCRFVKVDVAAHSPQMDPLRPRLVADLAGLAPAPATVAFFSTVTGEVMPGEMLDAEYWGQNLRRPVLFASAVQATLAAGYDTFVELSPHPVLVPVIEQCFPSQVEDSAAPAALPSCVRNEDEQVALLRSLGHLYVLGCPVDWQRLYPAGGTHVRLPHYPWQRERFWLDNIPGLESGSAVDGDDGGLPRGRRQHPLLGWEIAMAGGAGRRIWENVLNRGDYPLLYEHRVQNTLLLSASAFLALAVAAGHTVVGFQPLTLKDVVFHRPLLLDEVASCTVQTSIAAEGQEYVLQVYSRTDAGDWVLHLSAQLEGDCAAPASTQPFPASRDEIVQRLGHASDTSEVYADLAARGISFGALRHMSSARRSSNEALAAFDLAPAAFAGIPYLQWLDAVLQMTPLAAPPVENDTADIYIYVPHRLDELWVNSGEAPAAWGHVQCLAGAGSSMQQQLGVWDARDTLLAQMCGLQLVPLGTAAPARVEDWLYTPVWQPQALVQANSVGHKAAGKWVIFADAAGTGTELATLIRRAGGTAELVFQGWHRATAGPKEYTVDSTSLQGIGELFQLLFPADQESCAGIVYLWGLNVAGAECTSSSELMAAQQVSLGPLLQVIQNAARRRWPSQPKVWAVTQGVRQCVPDVRDRADAAGAALQSSLWGLGRVAGVEHPALWGGLIDLDPALAPAAAAEMLYAELTAASEDNEVALGLKERCVLRLAPAAAAPAQDWQLRRDAAYLVTGGLGGLGLLAAQRLAELGARRLVLMGRTALPPRSQWSNVDPGSRTGQQVAAVRSLEALGTAVHLVGVDVGDEAQMAAFMAQYEAEGWPPIRGVVHAAGTVRDRLLADLTWDEMAEVLHAKVAGSWLLHTLLPDLDFFVVFSSLGALLGQPGQGNYAAANAFADALVEQRRRAGYSGLSINWGPWSGIGFAAATGGQRVTQELARQGIGALEPPQGLDILAKLLAGRSSGQVAVLPVATPAVEARELPYLLRELHTAAASAAREEQAHDEPARSMRTMLLALEPAQRRATLAAQLQQAVGQVLRMPPARVGLAVPLGLLGLDSLMAMELRNRLELGLDIRLPATFVWNYPTIHELVPYLAERMDVPLEAAGTAVQARTGELDEIRPAEQETLGSASLDHLLADIETLSDEDALAALKAT